MCNTILYMDGTSGDTATATDIDRLYQTIYLQNFDYVWRQLRRLGIGSADVPDVTHDVFVVVHRRLDSYDRARPVRPWLFGILYRVAADHQRLFRQTRELLPHSTGDSFDPEDPSPRPDDALLDRQARAFASQALDGLDIRLRSVLEMHDLGGRAVPEIAEVLQIPVKTVYTRLRVARERLATAANRLMTTDA
jgi:RNA polymerase sigma-70 factor (ECF subfamily)